MSDELPRLNMEINNLQAKKTQLDKVKYTTETNAEIITTKMSQYKNNYLCFYLKHIEIFILLLIVIQIICATALYHFFFAEQLDAVQIHLNALNQVNYFKIICSNKFLNNEYGIAWLLLLYIYLQLTI